MLTEVTNVAQNIINSVSNKVGPTLSEVTNANIGDYVDLGNDPLGVRDTSKNWRIFYKEGNTVYAILADYLPNSTNYTTNAGLQTGVVKYKYSAFSSDRATLLAGLKHETAWDGLANGINGAQVSGTPTLTQLKTSYESKYTDRTIVLNGDETYGFSSVSQTHIDNSDTLYFPHTSGIDDCNGYWIASHYSSNNTLVWNVNWDGHVYNIAYDCTYYGVRPVVSLPISTKVQHTGDIWKIQK